MDSYRTLEIPVWGIAELELDTAALAPLLILRAESFPPPMPQGECYQGDPARIAQEVIDQLKREKLIGKSGGRYGL